MTPAALAHFTAINSAEQPMARGAPAEWGNTSGLIFIEVAPGDSVINFQKLDLSEPGYDGEGLSSGHLGGSGSSTSASAGPSRKSLPPLREATRPLIPAAESQSPPCQNPVLQVALSQTSRGLEIPKEPDQKAVGMRPIRISI